MRTPFAKCVAALVIACTLSLSVTSCSQPIDTGSKIPAQSQPFVALLALIGLGIGLTALHHHNESHGGGGGPPAVAAPASVQGLGIGAIDITLDPGQPGATGAVGTQGGGGLYAFIEVNSSGGNFGSYTLPSGYQPNAVAIDASGNDWFLDSSGNVKKCAPPATSVTACTPLLSFTDGLPAAGVRSIGADNTHLFIAQDSGSGTVSWVAFALDGTGRNPGAYVYGSGLGVYNKDAVQTTTGGSSISQFMVLHKDGSSYTVSLPGPATKNPFNLTPPPLKSANVATFDGINFYGFLGSPAAGAFQIGHYVGAGNTLGLTPGSLVNPTLTIAFDGRINPDRGVYGLPLSSLHTDGSLIEALDPAGNLVIFNAF
ncbi:MAG TPA: hypothetical protein VKR99_04670 [Candidatus Eremiobacteraceae bacterium]|nr:hypothetical protein [Candidatus Eremiobacteraceae bacterium]